MKTNAFTRLRILTRDWQRGMTPWRAGRRVAIVAWTVLMVALGGWWAMSWLANDLITAWEARIQHLLRPQGGQPEWWQFGDTVFHIGTMVSLVLTLELGRWLFRPAWPRWLAVAVAVAVAVGDELLQGLSPVRHCDWRDLLSDGIGAVLATVVMVAIARWIRRREAANEFL